MRARATKPKHREDAYFLGEQLRAHTPSRFRKEMRVFLQRFLPIAHHYPPATYSGPALFSAVSPRIYIRMVAAFPDAGATRGGKGERNRGSSIRRANFPTERTPKTFLGDIQCLRDASTRNVTHFVHCVYTYVYTFPSFAASHYSILGVESFDRSCFASCSSMLVQRCRLIGPFVKFQLTNRELGYSTLAR